MRSGLGLALVVACLAADAPAAAQEGKEGSKAPAFRHEGLGGYNLVEVHTTVVACRLDEQRVAKGDVVCELDATGLTDRLAVQDRVVEAAGAELRAARAAREAAEGEVDAFDNGTYKQELESILGEVALAEANLKRAEDRLEWSDRMLKKGYLSVEENTAELLMLHRAQLALEQIRTRRAVFERYAKNRTRRAMTAQVEAARATELSKTAALAGAEADRNAIRAQLGRCKVVAPVAGRVRFAPGVEPGAPGALGQLLFRIEPDAAATTSPRGK